MLRRPVKAAREKARVFIYLQNKFDDSSLEFTKSLNNDESNTYDQTNARTSGNIHFSNLLKALKEFDKKVFCRVESLSTTGNINISGDDTSLHILDSRDEELVNILQSFEMENTPAKASKRTNGG